MMNNRGDVVEREMWVQIETQNEKRVDTNVCPFVCLYVYVFVLACWCEFVLHNGFCVPILSIFKLFESVVVRQLN